MRSRGRVYRVVTLNGRYHYGWVVAVAAGTATLIGSEPLSLFGVFLGPIADDLGESRAAVSAIYWISFLALGIFSIVSGWATDRIGGRKVLTIASAGSIIPLVFAARSSKLWELYLWYGVIVGIARAGFLTPMVIMITIWFKKRQGLAVGIVSSGMAVGPMFFAPFFRYLIDNYGWGSAFLIMAALSAVILAPCCLLVRNDPSDLGLLPYGDDGDEKQAGTAALSAKARPSYEPLYYRKDVPNFFRYAMTTQPFFLLALIHFVGCVSHAIPLAHMVVMATDRGIDPIAASTVLGIATGVSAASRLGAPILSDRIGGRKVLVLFVLLQGISILWLLPAESLWVFMLFSVCFGLAYGGEMTPYPVLNRQYYGLAPIGAVFGFQSMIACIGMGIGGYMGGFLYDAMGNYTLAIWIAAIMGLIGAGLSYLLVDPFGKAPASAGIDTESIHGVSP